MPLVRRGWRVLAVRVFKAIAHASIDKVLNRAAEIFLYSEHVVLELVIHNVVDIIINLFYFYVLLN